MTDRELMQQALEALTVYDGTNGESRKKRVLAALRERLAQPEQEPVANIRIWHKNGEQHAELWNWDKGIETLPDGNYDLYTAPPQRKPLTPREIELLEGMIEVQLHHAAQCDLIANRVMADKQKGWDMERVELLRKLKEKNA